MVRVYKIITYNNFIIVYSIDVSLFFFSKLYENHKMIENVTNIQIINPHVARGPTNMDWPTSYHESPREDSIPPGPSLRNN